MAQVDIDTLDLLRAEVVKELVARGVKAEGWHSGGGIFGIQITLPSRNTLFATLDGREGGENEAFIGFDWNADDGSLLGTIESQERPYGGKYGPVGSAEQIAREITKIVGNLL